jgi:hypothetical protein
MNASPAPIGLPARGRAVVGRGERSSPFGASIFRLANLAYLLAVALIPAHLLFAAEDNSWDVRVLTAIPGILLVLEARNYLRNEPGEVPFLVVALLQYYAAFCFGIFFEIRFFDRVGPALITAQARTLGAVAVAVGGICMWGGARLGYRLGRDLRPWAERVMPPNDVPENWERAVTIYTGVCIVFALLTAYASNVIPVALGVPATYAFSLEMMIGVLLFVPSTGRSARLAQLLVALHFVIAMVRGQLDPLFRGGMAYATGRWAGARRFSVRVAAAVLLVYAVLQPIKGAYRRQVWTQTGRTGQDVSVSDRAGAWENALANYFQGDDHYTQRNVEDGAMARLSELAAVQHAFDVVPNRVDFLWAQGWLPIVYAPIPRFVWANKPTTQDTVQRYGVIFGRQDERGARTTAINLPLLVEGYWNLGWPGVILVTAGLGLWLGASQKMFAGESWALRATGVANITTLTVVSPIIFVYGSILQTFVGRVALCWMLYGLAVLLSRDRARVHGLAARRVGMRR